MNAKAIQREDHQVLQPGVYKKNRQEIRNTMAGWFAGPLNGSRVIDQPQDVRFPNEDTAIVISEGGIVFPGQNAVPSEGTVGPPGCWPSATAAGMSRRTTTAPRTSDWGTRRLPLVLRKAVSCPPGTALIV